MDNNNQENEENLAYFSRIYYLKRRNLYSCFEDFKNLLDIFALVSTFYDNVSQTFAIALLYKSLKEKLYCATLV